MRGRIRAVAAPLLASLILVPLIALGAIGWHYSDLILGPDTRPGRTGQRVLAHTDSTLTLAPTKKARRAGIWAIEWPGGYGRIGPLIAVDDHSVTTRFQLAFGVAPDTTARLAGYAPDADPRTWLGWNFDQVEVPARVGPLPAWFIHGTDSTWAIFVHGRAATRAEVLRMLPAYRSLGLPCLIMQYRNDTGAPHVDGGSYRLGATEWRDVEDAVDYARHHGARDVVLVGCSMGGGIVTQFLRRSSERGLARAAVLDAPALDWNAVFALASRQRHVPEAITEVGKFVASLRSGLEWSELTQSPHAHDFSTPMLIFHGDADETVPIAVSQRFATARPDLVTLQTVAGADHVESSNVDPDRYAATVSSWLRGRGTGAIAPPAPTRARH